MARGVNKVILVGNVGKDPEVRYSAGGMAVCTISVATSEKWTDKQSGEIKERTEWHRVKFFGRLAEIAGEYLKKGSQVYIEGSLRTEEYEKDGVKRYSTDIVAAEMQMLGGRQDGGGDRRDERSEGQRSRDDRAQSSAPRGNAGSSAPRGNAPQRGSPQPVQNTGFDDDDIPFN